MRYPGQWRLQRAVRALRARVIPHALILYYHRVADEASDPEWLCVSPRTFREHLEIVGRHYRPIGLRDLAARLREGRVGRGSVAITFDDGYLDNLEQAKPLLEQAGIPATVFVATGYMGGTLPFWWDELAFYLLECRTLPRYVRLEVNGERVWDCGDAALDAVRSPGWNVVAKHDPTPRHAVYRELAPLVKQLSYGARENVLAALAGLCGVERPRWTQRRCCTAGEMQALERGGVVEIGAHGKHHTLLSLMDEAGQSAEIREGKTVLEALLGHGVDSFAYPYGGTPDYTPATQALVRGAGFQVACTTAPGCVHAGTDAYALPRFHVPELDGVTFLKYLREWDEQYA